MVLALKEPATMGRAGNTTSHTHRASFSCLVSLETRTLLREMNVTRETFKAGWEAKQDDEVWPGWW